MGTKMIALIPCQALPPKQLLKLTCARNQCGHVQHIFRLYYFRIISSQLPKQEKSECLLAPPLQQFCSYVSPPTPESSQSMGKQGTILSLSQAF